MKNLVYFIGKNLYLGMTYESLPERKKMAFEKEKLKYLVF